MKKAHFSLLVALIVMVMIGCISKPPPRTREWVLRIDKEHDVLDQYSYWYNPIPFYVSSDVTALRVELNCLVAPSYGFEVWIMTPFQFNTFVDSGVVSVKAYWIVYEGSWALTTYNLSPGNYHIVVDNTNYGWVKTKWNPFVNYYVYTNVKLYTYQFATYQSLEGDLEKATMSIEFIGGKAPTLDACEKKLGESELLQPLFPKYQEH